MTNFRQTLMAIAIHEVPLLSGERLAEFLAGWWKGTDILLRERPYGQIITEAENLADHPDYAVDPRYARR